MNLLENKIVYIDGVDWQHELEATDVVIWPTLTGIRKNVPCTDVCGVVKCEIKAFEWVYPQNLGKGTKRKLNRQRHIDWLQKRIATIQATIARENSYKEFSINDEWLVVTDCEKITLHSNSHGGVARLIYATKKATYHQSSVKKPLIFEDETVVTFKARCEDLYGVDLKCLEQ
jgi:hypothetical protein